MTAQPWRCVCGHMWATHGVDDEAGCELCACRRFLSAHLPGQVMLGDGE